MKNILTTMLFMAISGLAFADEKPTVILLGDSVRMNYQLDVANKLKETAVVWAPDENCQDTAYFIANLDKWLDGKNPAVIHFNVGLHDVFQDTPGKPRRTPIQYAQNLRKIITSLEKKFPDATFIFANTTPVIESRQADAAVYKRVVRTNADIDRINLEALKVLAEYNVIFNDLHKVCVDGGTETILRDDGTHLSENGAWTVSEQTASIIKGALDARAARAK